MSDTLLDVITDQTTDVTHPWREFYLLVSLELRSIDHLLTIAAQLVGSAVDAEACLVTHTAPRGVYIQGHYGQINPELQAVLEEAERRFVQGYLLPLQHTLEGVTCISLPLAAGREYIGALHVVAPAWPCDLASLQFAAVLLSNTLRRQLVADQFVQAERKRVEQGLAMQYAVTSVLAAAPTLQEAIPRVLATIGERLHWDLGVLWTLDRKEQVLRCSGFWHSPAIETGSFEAACWQAVFKKDEGLPGRVWAAGTSVSIPNLINDPGFTRILISAGLNGALGIPILNGTEVCGVLEYFSRGVLHPDANVLTSLMTIGSQIGQFIERKRAQEALREADRQFRATFEQAAVGIAHVGLDGRWLRVNQRLCDIVGYERAELQESRFQDITHPEDLKADIHNIRRLLAKEIQNYSMEKRYLRKDGSFVWVELTVSLMCDTRGAPKYFITVIEDISARKQTEAENARLYEELRVERDRLIKREVEVRAQIGRDLHDGPVQQVAVATIEVQHARRVAQREPRRLPETLDDLEAHLKRVTHDLRNVLYELRPLGITEDGLEGVLRQYVERFRDPSGLRIHLDVPRYLRRLDVDREAATFIIVQEAVNNAPKHAQARNLWINVLDQGNLLCVEVRDDGRGFDLQATQSNYIKRGSFGLLNMRERAQLIGGTCEMWSQPGLGTTVTVRVPF